MKVIKNNFKKTPIHIFCEHCGSELEVTQEDSHAGWLGIAHIKCPCCGQETMVEELEGITLTKNNIQFPEHFWHTNKDIREIEDVSNYEIQDVITKGITSLEQFNELDYFYTSFRNLLVVIFRNRTDEEYHIIVTKDFYETFIPFEAEEQ